MTQERVILLGERALETSNNVITTICLIFVMGGLLGFGIVLGMERSSKWISRSSLASTSIFLFLGGFILGAITEDSNAKREAKQVEMWKKDVATPYVNSLPLKKKSLFKAEIDQSFSSSKENQTNRPSKLTPFILSYREGEKVLTVKGEYEVRTSLDGNEKPYVTYQDVSKDLGVDFKKGWYNGILYLPKEDVLISKN